MRIVAESSDPVWLFTGRGGAARGMSIVTRRGSSIRSVHHAMALEAYGTGFHASDVMERVAES